MDRPEQPNDQRPTPSRSDSSSDHVEPEPSPKKVIPPVTPPAGETEDNLQRRRDWFHKRTGR
jgi:hypothetical protein